MRKGGRLPAEGAKIGAGREDGDDGAIIGARVGWIMRGREVVEEGEGVRWLV